MLCNVWVTSAKYAQTSLVLLQGEPLRCKWLRRYLFSSNVAVWTRLILTTSP